MAKTENTEKMLVLVRVRPLHKEEATQRSPWKLSSKSIASSKTCRPSVPCYSFTLDRVYGTKTTTFEIYEAHIKTITKSVVSGVNGTVIAYGQPGSGMTYTIRGSPEEKGILVLAVEDVFKHVQEADNREFLVRVSYFKVANEELVDLLASTSQELQVQEDDQGDIVVRGLREEIVVGSDEVLSLLEFADAHSSIGSTNASKCRRSHSIFRMVIESRINSQGDCLSPQVTDMVQVSVLHLVEVSALVSEDNTAEEEAKHDRSLKTLQTVISMLSEDVKKQGDPVPYSQSKLTHILKPSLGGNTRTCIICQISPAMVHMDDTVATLLFAAKATRVINCSNGSENWQNCRDRALLKRQRRTSNELRKKLKEDNPQQFHEQILSHRNALLMIEMESEQMSFGLLDKAPTLCWRDNVEQDQNMENLTSGGESGLDRCIEMLEKVDFLLQSKMTRQLNNVECESLAERRKLAELREVFAQWNKEQQELFTRQEYQCSTLQQKIAELEAEKAIMKKRLQNHKINAEAVRPSQCVLSSEDERVVNGGLDSCRRCDAHNTIIPAGETCWQRILQVQVNGVGIVPCELQASEFLLQQASVQPDTRAHLLVAEETKERRTLLKEKKGNHTTRKKRSGHSTANKVCQDYQNPQGQPELLGLWKELAVAKETISTLEDERDACWRDPKRIKEDGRESQFHDKNLIQVAAALEELDAEMESTTSTIDALVELVSESFLLLTADLKSFQEGVAEVKFLSGITGDTLESLEKAKLQLTELSHEKLASEKELHSMKAELAELECVVERQSGVLKVLSENESLLSELSSLRAAMKEAAGASEVQVLSIHHEYSNKLMELDTDCQKLKQEHLQLEEKYTSVQHKLENAQAEVLRLSQTLNENSERQKDHTDTQLELPLEEESQEEKKRKYAKPRHGTTRSNAAGDLQANFFSLQVVEKLGKELKEKDAAHKEASVKLGRAEEAVVRLTIALEDKTRVEEEKQQSLVKTEAEVVRLTKLLEDTFSGVEVQHKTIQLELVTSQNKVESLTREAEELKMLENSYIETLDRLVKSEVAVARLTESISTQLDDKSILEQDRTNILYKLEISETELRRLTASLSAESQEKDTLKMENNKILVDLSKSELQVLKLAEVLSIKEGEMKELQESHQRNLDMLTKAQEEMRLLKARNQELSYRLTKERRERLLLEASHQEPLDMHTRDQEDKLASSETRMTRFTQRLAGEREDKDRSEEHKEILDHLTIEELQPELLENIYQKVTELTDTGTGEVQKNYRLEMTKETGNNLSRDQGNMNDLVNCFQVIFQNLNGEHEESNVSENIHQGGHDQHGHDQHADSESRVVQLSEILTRELSEKNILDKAHPDVLDLLIKGHGKMNIFEKRNLETLSKLIKGQEVREDELKETRLSIVEIFAASVSKAAQLAETSATQQLEKSLLEKDYQETVNKLGREKDERRKVGIEHQEALHKLAQANNERDLLESIHQTVVAQLADSESKVRRLNEMLSEEWQEKKDLEDHCQQICIKFAKEQEEHRLLEKNCEEALPKFVRKQEERRYLIEKASTVLANVASTEFKLRHFAEILTIGKQENCRMKNSVEISGMLTREQEQRTLEKNNQEQLQKFRREKDLSEETHQYILDKLSVSEIKVAQLTKILITDMQSNGKLEIGYQKMINEESLQTNNQEIINELRKEKRKYMLVEQNELTCLESIVLGLCEGLPGEFQEQNKLELKLGNFFDNLHFLRSKIASLTGSLTKELECEFLERHQGPFSSKLKVTGPIGNLSKEAVENESLDPAHYVVLNRLANSEMVASLTNMLEDPAGLPEELQTLQHSLASTERKLLSQTDKSKVISTTGGHEVLQLDLIATNSEISKLDHQTERLQKRTILNNSSTTEAYAQSLNDVLGEKMQVDTECKDIVLTLATLKTEVMNLETSLADKSGPEQEQRKELVSKQSEISKLMKELGVLRKLVKAQKQLICKLTSSQAEVVRLRNLGGKSQSPSVQVEQVTTVSTVGGSVLNHSRKQTLEEQTLGKFVSKEAGVIQLQNVIEQKEHARAHLELSTSEKKIRGLTTTLEDKLSLDKKLRQLWVKLSAAGVLSSREDVNSSELVLEEFSREFLQMRTELFECKRELESKAGELKEKECWQKDKDIACDVDYEALHTIIAMREKERDELREHCRLLEGKLQHLRFECEKKREQGTVEKGWKSKCQKAEREAGNLRKKLEQLNKEMAWVVRDKELLQERLTCCETQLATLREVFCSTKEELEVSHQKMLMLTARHQSDVAALVEELASKKVQKSNLEAELNRLLNNPHQASVPSLQEYGGLLPCPNLRADQWPYRQVPRHHHDSY